MFPGTVIADGGLRPEKLVGWMDTEVLREEAAGLGLSGSHSERLAGNRGQRMGKG